MEGSKYEVITEPQDFEKVKKAISDAGLAVESAEITRLPSATVKLGVNEAKNVLALLESLEDDDDVQNVYSNLDIPDDVLQQLT